MNRPHPRITAQRNIAICQAMLYMQTLGMVLLLSFVCGCGGKLDDGPDSTDSDRRESSATTTSGEFEFLDLAIHRIETESGNIPQHIQDIIGLMEDQDPVTEDELEQLREFVSVSNLYSEVTFTTTIPGATVYYRLVAKPDEAPSTSGATDATDRIPIGRYEVWVSRDGRDSPASRHNIVSRQETIALAE